MNQFDSPMTAVANVRKGQTYMLYKGKLQPLSKQSMIC